MAPKKGQGNRGGGGSKKNATTPAASAADDSFIVFSNSKDEPKSTDKGKAPVQLPPEETEVPKRDATRKLIGGASWTGKLPLNLLSEHCQKQKWEKPEYTMVRVFCPFILRETDLGLLAQILRRVLVHGYSQI